MFKESSLTLTPNLTSAERYTWVDYARGIAIMFVVYRHVVVGMTRSDIQLSSFAFQFQELFYNFRMPLFFVLSGAFLARGLQKKPFQGILKDRAATLLYPYLLWGGILITLQIIFSKFTNSNRSWADYFYLFTQPRKIDHLWYLLALFNTSLLYLLLRLIVKKTELHIIIGIVLYSLTITSLFEGNSLISDVAYFYLYLVSGIYFSESLLNQSLIKQLSKPKNLVILISLFLAGQWFWYTNRDEENIYLPLFFIINLIGCFVVYVLSDYLSRFEANRWLSFLGEHSIYIYILHMPVAAVMRSLLSHFGFNLPSVIILTLCWLTGIAVPVIIYQTFREYGVQRLFSMKQNKLS